MLQKDLWEQDNVCLGTAFKISQTVTTFGNFREIQQRLVYLLMGMPVTPIGFEGEKISLLIFQNILNI